VPLGRVITTLIVILSVPLLVACGGDDAQDRAAKASSTTAAAAGRPTSPSPATAAPTTTTVLGRPDWLGTRVLPRRPDGYGEIQPTPPELRDRRIGTVDLLPPPAGEQFASTVQPVPDAVRDRSTWSADCPVGIADLRYVTVSFFGFDGRFHTGELLVHTTVADTVVGAFRDLHAARFPIEEMRITRAEELDAPPTGDGNNTGSFTCRPSRGTTTWSNHAYGKAVDINPFHNPYVKRDVVLPELASAYTDRGWVRPGMFVAGQPTVTAFTSSGWGWGGAWRSAKDYMHFSADGR
jgi:hypothetical protein